MRTALRSKFFCVCILTFVFKSFGEGSLTSLDENQLSLQDLFSIKLTTGSLLELDISKSPLSLTIIDKAMVQTSGARHLSELLEIYVPGFVYSFNPYNGTLWFMRGVSNDRNTKVIALVNGHKLNTEARDGFQAELTLGLLSDIERIEVLRGPAALLYGSGAIAGIINIITKKPKADTSSYDMSYTQEPIAGKVYEFNSYFGKDKRFSASVSAGYRVSDGLGIGKSSIYGIEGIAYDPKDIITNTKAPKNGIPSDGSYGFTPGNYKLGLGLTSYNLEGYFRITKQVEDIGAWQIVNPWPSYPLDTTGINLAINYPRYNFSTSKSDALWSKKGIYKLDRLLREQYVVNASTGELKYTHTIDDNQIVGKVGGDISETKSQISIRPGYEAFYKISKEPIIKEIWGEQRAMISGMFLLKSIENLKAAVGMDFRYDRIGQTINGDNFVRGYDIFGNELSEFPTIDQTNYTNFACYLEAAYDITPWYMVTGGVRGDFHTRANMFNFKIANSLNFIENHTLKLILSSSSNNGTADNYELGKNEYVFAYNPPNRLDTKHALEPERVYNLEVASTHLVGSFLTVMPSVSLGRVDNLFAWNGGEFRVINTPEYYYLNAEAESRVQYRFLNSGFNLTYQRPLVDTSKTAITLANKTIIDPIDSIVTKDGKNFLDIPKFMMKAFVDITPLSWICIHNDWRFFFGLPGREPYMIQEKYAGYQTFGVDTGRVITKWNMSIHFMLESQMEISGYIYNVLGNDQKPGMDEQDGIGSPVNTLRWVYAGGRNNRALYSMDQRTFGVKITKNF